MTLPGSVEDAWALILGAPTSLAAAGVGVGSDGRLTLTSTSRSPASATQPETGTVPTADGHGHGSPPDVAAEVRALLEIFLPLQLREEWVVGQLGQSLDGRIATESGHSHYINGPEDIRRLHGLRALADAVVVGAGTALSDDPRLTARHLSGPDPTRVVLDPRGRLPAALRVFSDGGPPTLWIRSDSSPGAAPPASASPPPSAGPGAVNAGAGGVTVVHIPVDRSGHFPPAAILEQLRARGLRRILVEGGGHTVSTFLEARLLDRLHICVAPLLIGSGRTGITLPAVETLDEALRPRALHHALGRDVLFDLDLSPPG